MSDSPSNNHPRDQVFAKPKDMLVDFVFDEQVANVFPDMIRRSVPGYDTVIPMLGVFAGRYIQPDSNVYDLGCSLGAATLAIRRHIAETGCRIIAVDNAKAMTQQCEKNMRQDDSATPVEIICDDILNVRIENASLVIINFTLQFLPIEKREELLVNIYQGLRPGGVLLIAEKLLDEDNKKQAFQETMHTEFKRANGYSELEISQKRSALENVLIPETEAIHINRMKKVGFGLVSRWFQCFNFSAYCAVKD